MADEDIDTTNKFLIAGQSGLEIVFLRPVPQRLTRADAILLAAWIVAITGDEDAFKRVLQAVHNA